MSKNIIDDATPAFRGYRLQVLYTLMLILDDSHKDTVVQPEGLEDVGLFEKESISKKLIPIESFQVKARTKKDLTLSDFNIDSENSFFYRVDKLLRKTPNIKINIVSFGPIGSELRKGLNGDRKAKDSLSKKIAAKGIIGADRAEEILQEIHLIKVTEEEIKDIVFKNLSDILTGIDPESSFEILNYWLYKCAEDKTQVTQKDVIQKIEGIGRFISETKLHRDEWFTTIIPLIESQISEEKRLELKNQFFEGFACHYDHILAGVDIFRPKWLKQIRQGFKKHNVVLLHAASGQGKSTLAYRYLRNYYPNLWCFQIDDIDDRPHAMRVASALNGHANALNQPMIIYIDVEPGNKVWSKLIGEISLHKSIQILITIRDEDFKQSNVNQLDFGFTEIELDFDHNEAALLFTSLEQTNPSSQYIDFDDAWKQFGSGGPLLEFVYLVTQGELLKARLDKQVRSIRNGQRTGERDSKSLDVIWLVSLASAYGGRVKSKRLSRHLGLDDPKGVFDPLQKEYMFRLTEDQSLILGLHPIRSTILIEIIFDSDKHNLAFDAFSCLKLLHEEEVEQFLLNFFLKHSSEVPCFLKLVNKYQPSNWQTILGITKALIWYGLLDYVGENRELISDVFRLYGVGNLYPIDLDISDVTKGEAKNWIRESNNCEESTALINSYHARQTDKNGVFRFCKNWLSSHKNKPNTPKTKNEWAALAHVVFWLRFLGINWPIKEWFKEIHFVELIADLPIYILADLVLGLSYQSVHDYQYWFGTLEDRIKRRFQKEMQICFLEENNEELTSHYIIPLDLNFFEKKPETDTNNQTAIIPHLENAIPKLSRKLFPFKKSYGCKGYGHQISAELPYDSTIKQIPIENLHLSRLVIINSKLRGLAKMPYRPDTWEGFAHQVLDLRKEIFRLLSSFQSVLIRFLQDNSSSNISHFGFQVDDWRTIIERLKKPPISPKTAVDPWGIDELSMMASANGPSGNELISLSKNQQSFHYWFHKYVTGLDKYFKQSLGVINSNCAVLRKQHITDTSIGSPDAKTSKENQKHLPLINLTEVELALVPFQKAYFTLLGKWMGEEEYNFEKDERKLFQQFWRIWYCYTYHPNKVFQAVRDQVNKQIKKITYYFKSALRKGFRNNNINELAEVYIYSERVLWEEENTLWIAIDANYPFETYQTFDYVLELIRTVIGKMDDSILVKLALEIKWSSIAIIPLVQGKSLFLSAWKLSLKTILWTESETELGWWNFTEHSIPKQAFIDLQLNAWEESIFSEANESKNLMLKLKSIVTHLGDLDRLPDCNGAGEEILKDYFIEYSKQIEVVYTQTQNSTLLLINLLGGLSDDKLQKRYHLLDAYNALTEMNKHFHPKFENQTEQLLSLKGTKNWASSLSKSAEFMFIAYLHWLADIIDQKSNCNFTK